MGFLSDIFGGGESSSSSVSTRISKKRQSSFIDNSIIDLGNTGLANLINLRGVRVGVSGKGARGKSNLRVNVTNRGLAGAEVADIIGDLSFGFNDLLQQLGAERSETTGGLVNVIESTTGAETEAGRLIGKLAVPGLIVAGIIAAIMLFQK